MNNGQREDRTYRFVVLALVVSCVYNIGVVTNGMLYHLLLPLTFILPMSNYARYSTYTSNINLLSLGLFLHVVIILLWVLYKRNKLHHMSSAPFVSMLLILLVRLLGDLMAMSWVYYLFFDVLCLAFLLLIYQLDFAASKLHVLRTVYWIGMMAALTAWLYFFLGLNLRLGSVIFRELRLAGFLFDSILAGFMFGLSMIAGYELYSEYRDQWFGGGVRLMLSLVVLGSACFLTGSRASIFFAGIALLSMVFKRKSFGGIPLVIVFAIVAFVFFNWIISSSDLDFTSDSSRSYKFSLALRVFINHPLLGVGSNMFYKYDTVYRSNPHNLPLTLMAENGIVGLLSYILWLITFVINICFSKDNFFKWASVAFLILSMILGVLTNTITILIMIILTWGCDKNSRLAFVFNAHRQKKK